MVTRRWRSRSSRASRQAFPRLLSVILSNSSRRDSRVSETSQDTRYEIVPLTCRSVVYENNGASKKPLNSFDVAAQLWRANKRPIITFYRGVTSNLIGSSAAWGAFFGMKELTQSYITSLQGTDAHSSPATRSQASYFKSSYFFSAVVAGLATQALTNPIFVVKTRMLATDRSSPHAYLSTAAAFRDIWRQEGWRAFYSGMGISMVSAFQGGIQFALYDPMTRWYKDRQAAVSGAAAGREQDGTLHPGVTMVMSGIGRAVPLATTYPYQVIRSRLQVRDAEARFGKGIRGVSWQLWREAGIRGFYRGLTPTICRTMPATWATFLAYEQLKPYLTQRWMGDRSRERADPDQT